jgi:glycosyltransferase involved in cell wall biosynthesis
VRIRILPIEAHQQRYTCEWVPEIPKRLRRAAKRKGVAAQIRSIKGTPLRQGTTPEAFLNFAATNIYKGEQIIRLAKFFNNGEVQPGDIFVVTDAWHPGVHQIRYISELLKVPVRIIGLWHAGSYDPNDFLGRIARRQWARSMEQALFDAYDLNVFATRYQVELFCNAFDLSPEDRRIAQCGWPMEYLPSVLTPYAGVPKENIVLFPHQLAPEKHVDMFRDLAGSFPDWRFIVCQEMPLPKEEYHRLLARGRVVFSCSLQETLGIGCYEGVLAGAVPVVPDRLSYREMYPEEFRYSSAWTLNEDAYRRNKPALVAHLREVLTRAEQGGFDLEGCRQQLTPFFSGDELYAKALEGL